MAAKVKILDESLIQGPVVKKGDTVKYSARFFLNRGDEVTQDFKSIELYDDQLTTRIVEDTHLIEHATILGKRQSIAGVELALTGMSAGSFREVLIPPHLAYGKKGTNVVPPDAVIRAKIWLHEITVDA